MNFNIHFFILLCIAVIVFFADILIYAFNLNYYIAIAISIAVAICVIFKFRKKIKLRSDFEKQDFICFAFALIAFLVRCFKLDNEWDTFSYHLYLGENPFIDKINFDFFPGSPVNSFLFPLGDRIYYLFRKLIGYRFGTTISIYAMITVYYQVKRLIKTISKSDSKLIPIIANMSYLSYCIYGMIGTYYIDIFSIVFILELIYIVFSIENLIENKEYLYLSFLITGIATGIKLTNLIFAVPVYLYVLIKNVKNLKKIKLKDIPICLILFLMPFIVYEIDNIIQTRKSVFSMFYELYFKRQYF